MRAKWTAHELLHGLVGFAWRPDAAPLFLATAGRLAELLPVVLWYSFDEAHLRRCPIHAQGGALYRRVCPECEAIAGPQVDELHAEAILEDGRAFLERELLAVGRTRSLGRPVPHVHGSLDLCSDGVAYAAAHGARLRSEAFRRYADAFLVEGGGWVADLDALEARVLAVLDALTEGTPLPSLAPSRAHGQARWTLQDLGWRLLAIAHDTEGEAHAVLTGLADALGAACRQTADPAVSPDGIALAAESAIAAAFLGYCDLHEDWVLPEPLAVFALGYHLPGMDLGRSADHLGDGVRSAVPLTAAVLGQDLAAVVRRFTVADRPVRVPVGRRFATWLAGAASAPLSDLARYEAELTHLAAADPDVLGLGTESEDGRYRLASGVRILRAGVDVVELARGVDFGDWTCMDLVLHDVDGGAVPDEPVAIALVRRADGQPQVIGLTLAVADCLLGLGDGALPALDGPALDEVRELGLIVPVRWAVG